MQIMETKIRVRGEKYPKMLTSIANLTSIF